MRPGKNDVAVLYQISGLQLTELQKYTGDMCDAFGLDERIYKYKSTGSYLDITSHHPPLTVLTKGISLNCQLPIHLINAN